MKSIIQPERLKELTNRFSSLSPIIVVGDIGIDKYTQGTVKRISPEAPVPVLEVEKEWLKLGLAANISHNLQALGVKAVTCGVVGEDKNAESFEELLEEIGLSTWGLIRSDCRPTIFKERVTTPTQQICRIDYEKNHPISLDVESRLFDRILENLEETKSDGKRAIILEDYAKGTMTESLIKRVVSELRDPNHIISVDPGRTTPPMYFKGVDLLKPNQVEAELMVKALGYNETEIAKMAEILADKLEVSQLVITLGPDGMALLDTKSKGNLQIIPTVANEVFDVSGAGDTSISLLTAALLAGASLEEAAWIGNCGAGVVVGKTGTATVNLKELHDYHHQIYSKNK